VEPNLRRPIYNRPSDEYKSGTVSGARAKRPGGAFSRRSTTSRMRWWSPPWLNTFGQHRAHRQIANMAQLVNVIAPIFTNEKGLFLQTIYFPSSSSPPMFAARRSRFSSIRPDTATRRFDKVPYLDVSARSNSGAVVLNVVNRHPDQDIEAEIEPFTGRLDVAHRERSRSQDRQRLRFRERENGEECRERSGGARRSTASRRTPSPRSRPRSPDGLWGAVVEARESAPRMWVHHVNKEFEMSLENVARRAKVSDRNRLAGTVTITRGQNTTRARVLKAIAELNYHPNLHARILAEARAAPSP